MTRLPTTRSAVVGRQRASDAARSLGSAIRESRLRRRLSQKELGARAGVSRSQVAKIETGRGSGVRPAEWFALADVLGRYFRFELARDPLEEPADAGHLAIQQLVLRLAPAAGFEDRRIELAGRSGMAWTDVAMVRRAERVVVLVECVNTITDLGSSFRSSDRKLAGARQLGVAVGASGPPLEVSVCWVVRDSARNRELLARYAQIFAARFTGSSVAWVEALTHGGSVPKEAGLVWSDRRSERLFAHRPPRSTAPRSTAPRALDCAGVSPTTPGTDRSRRRPITASGYAAPAARMKKPST